ncbi:hypothetical protein N7474_003005 [Penicillium riverlandense]|uniref:uncharacterized protein n=1 Tax=Penicillium riverlandense TaxID=1903569 RepID=UPI0025473EF6|nr:uncharacterized protein N7474_003005 [Penicillium riverlandense]KAJ5825867.1 hypothetical protein N7474_003005 [Penicillium riverlandense]
MIRANISKRTLKDRWQKWLGSAYDKSLWETNKLEVVQLDVGKNHTQRDFESGLGSLKIDIVIHTASTINLGSSLAKIKDVIIEGSLGLAAYASSRQDIERFVYVSTAFANAHLQSDGNAEKSLSVPIDESIYPLGDAQRELEDVRNGIESDDLEIFPWAYTYAKHLTERLLMQKLGDKLLIVRPSIIGPVLHFPVKGFSVPKSTPCVTLAAGVMLLPTWRMTLASRLPGAGADATCNVIPVDVGRLIAFWPISLWICSSGPCLKVKWIKEDWHSARIHPVGRLFKILGTSFDFSDYNTIQLEEKMGKSEQFNTVISEKGVQIPEPGSGSRPQLFVYDEQDLIDFGTWKVSVKESMEMFAKRDWAARLVVRVLY